MKTVFSMWFYVVCLLLPACSGGVTIVGESPLEPGTYSGTNICTITTSFAGQTISQQVSSPETVTINNAGLPLFEGKEVAPGLTSSPPGGAGVTGTQTITSVITTTDAVTVESDVSAKYDFGNDVFLPIGGSGTVVFAPGGEGSILESSNFVFSGSSDEFGFVSLSGVCSATLSRPHVEQPAWDVFKDPSGQSLCGVINAASLEFAVRLCDGALVLITGRDAGFGNTFVTLDGEVQIDGQFAGFVVYDEDGEGFFTLWWVSEEGFVIDFDDVAYEPFETDFLPSDFVNVPCAAADFWDGDGDCNAEFGNEIMLAVAFVGGDG